MIPRMDDLASQHIHELHREADARRSTAEPQETRRDHDAGRTPRLRRHVGFALVEAGFYLLGTDRLAARD
jgi:hypothetical protein